MKIGKSRLSANALLLLLAVGLMGGCVYCKKHELQGAQCHETSLAWAILEHQAMQANF